MAVSTRKTTGAPGKSTRSGSEALAACVAKTAPETEAAAEPADTAALTEANRRSLQNFVEANVAIMNGMSALSTEMAEFGGKRLNANLERSQSLMTCDDAEKALRIQSEFFEAAMRQYLEQAGNVMEIMASISMGFWTVMEQRKEDPSEQEAGKSG